LLEARSVLWRDNNHHARCQHGCLDCVLTYDVMQEATAMLLRRREACEVLNEVLNRWPIPHGPRSGTITDTSPQVSGKRERLSRQERKRRLAL
jgi:hypothetical protein